MNFVSMKVINIALYSKFKTFNKLLSDITISTRTFLFIRYELFPQRSGFAIQFAKSKK